MQLNPTVVVVFFAISWNNLFMKIVYVGDQFLISWFIYLWKLIIINYDRLTPCSSSGLSVPLKCCHVSRFLCAPNPLSAAPAHILLLNICDFVPLREELLGRILGPGAYNLAINIFHRLADTQKTSLPHLNPYLPPLSAPCHWALNCNLLPFRWLLLSQTVWFCFCFCPFCQG